MHRITINFDKKAYDPLQENAVKKGVSLAQYLRDLIEIGRQVEEVAQVQPSSTSKGSEDRPLPGSDINLWKNNLLWTLESRYLLRYLVDNMTQQPLEKREGVLNAVKEKAQALVTELLRE